MAFTEQYEVVVVGAGHAGCEAALAAARMGMKTALITMNLDLIAQMSCNPAVGGVAKGHLVREIDAMGGAMGLVTDAVGIQFRLLNTSRGPAVWSPRAQCDKLLYRIRMREFLESQPNLHIRQAEVVELLFGQTAEPSANGTERSAGLQTGCCEGFQALAESAGAENPFSGMENPAAPALHETGEAASPRRRVTGVRLRDGRLMLAGATILTTGTFLNGLIHCGEHSYSAGRNGEAASNLLGDALRSFGLRICRLKTGTPARIDGRTIRWEAFPEQPGDADPTPFSFRTTRIAQPQIHCHIAFTTPETLRIIRENVHRSAMYSGRIEGVGPRYCPSIEDKIVKFPDKTQHQFFLEPEGLNTHEVYINGMSTSMPMEVQWRMIHSIPGLEDAEILRPGYAIEYDAVDPTELDRTLKVKSMDGLYLAGQINGTSGYEEAGCQGLMAGVNAALALKGQPAFTLDRTEAYTGILVDDLISKGTNEPYRMFTSRAEFRLHLRIDNADRRLTPKARQIGLISEEHWAFFQRKQARMAALGALLQGAKPSPQQLEQAGLDGLASTAGLTWAQLLKRPEVTVELALQTLGAELQGHLQLADYRSLAEAACPELSVAASPAEAAGKLLPPPSEQAIRRGTLRAEARAVETEIKFAGYLDQQKRSIEKLKAAETVTIPEWLDYAAISGLSREMREKLERVRPSTIGQASRIPGVTPAALSLVHVSIRLQGQKRSAAK